MAPTTHPPIPSDLQRFATRAAQLELHRPIIAYWLEYYLLQQLLARQLHLGPDSESMQAYALHLMEKLERTKVAATDTPAFDCLADDIAAKAYVEEFALETFARAEQAQRLGKVTKQTADTWAASGVFLDLLGVWGEVDGEMAKKSRFAKFHALRIAKAIKKGEDPNLTNPVVEEVEGGEDGVGTEHGQGEIGDEEGVESELKATERSSRQESGSGTHPTPNGDAAAPHDAYDVSPIEPRSGVQGRQHSAGGGYFPNLPSAPVSDPPVDATLDTDMSDLEPTFSSQTTIPPGDPASPPTNTDISTPTLALPRHSHHPLPPAQPAASPQLPAPAPLKQPPAVIVGGYNNNPSDEAVLAAQKHAKWAISALNFEDAATAVRELRLALAVLGAS